MSEQEKQIVVERTIPGHAHTQFVGTYSGPVTKKDIEEKFSNSFFGGRWGNFGFGRFTYIRHDD